MKQEWLKQVEGIKSAVAGLGDSFVEDGDMEYCLGLVEGCEALLSRLHEELSEITEEAAT